MEKHKITPNIMEYYTILTPEVSCKKSLQRELTYEFSVVLSCKIFVCNKLNNFMRENKQKIQCNGLVGKLSRHSGPLVL